MPLFPQTLPVYTHSLKPEDLGRGIAAIYVEATYERYSYLNDPRRNYVWHVYLKLSGGRGASGAWDVVELRRAKAGGTNIDDLHECFVFSSKTYPEYDTPGSSEASRFRCTLTPTALLTVKEAVELVSTKRYVADPKKLSAWTEDVGTMWWCLDVVRALKEAGLVEQVGEDKLMAEFINSDYRFELAYGSTLVV